jgi:adenine deaminase
MGSEPQPDLDRNALVAAALGEVQLDLVLRGVTLLNVFTGELYPADLGIAQGRIACVGPDGGGMSARETLDRSGLIAIPGLIDTHLHVESSMVRAGEYARAVIPRGTTTVLIDPHELANVFGCDGVRYMVEASEDLPLRTLVMVPSCVPSAEGLETAGASFGVDDVSEMLTWPRVVGLAEVMDYDGVLRRSERMMGLIETTLARGGLVQGHAPLVTGRPLAAYAAAGIDSDHETQRSDEALEKLRAGMFLEARESSLALNAAAAAGALRGRGYLPNVTLCTDDVTPEDLLASGHIDHVARRLVEEGLDPVDVVRFATLNAANRIRRHDLGALAPGRIADIVLLSDLARFEIQEVYVAGQLMARAGKALFEPRPATAPVVRRLERQNSVHLPIALDADRFRLRPDGLGGRSSARVRAIEIRHGASPETRFATLTLPVADGELVLGAGVNRLAIVERHGGHGGVTCVPLLGFGLHSGAVASTVSHDSHHIAVVGADRDDMLAACRALEKLRGGLVVVVDGTVRAAVPLPVGGLISLEPVETVADQLAAFRRAVADAGIGPEGDAMKIVAFALVVSPAAKLSDLGLVDVDRQALVPLLVDP